MKTALDRFAEKCRFDPVTGCVLWTAGTTSGQGNTTRYGAFKFEGRRWFAHRWAAIFIHELPVNGVTVGHCCPAGPNSLCVQHLRPETIAENNAERNSRVAAAARAAQTARDRQYWLLVEKGISEPPPPPIHAEIALIPWPDPPVWFAPYHRPVDAPVIAGYSGDCPF